jgi:hypothetical protein
VAEVAGVAGVAVEQLAVDDDAAADARRHRQHAVVVDPLRGALPPLGERQRLAVEIAVHAQPAELAEPGAQGELAPRRDVHRRHRLAVARDGPGRSDADADDAHLVAIGGVELLLDDAGEVLEVGVGSDVGFDEDDRAIEQLAARRHETSGELRAADVDPEHDGRQLARRRERFGGVTDEVVGRVRRRGVDGIHGKKRPAMVRP